MSTRVFIYGREPAFFPRPESIIIGLPDVRLIGITDDFDRVSYVARTLFGRVDVMLLSCAAMGTTEIDVIRNVQPISTLVLSHTRDVGSIVAALRAGARGYMTDIASGHELLRAIQLIESGGAAFCRVGAQQLKIYFSSFHDQPGMPAFPELTDREREVLDLIAQGLSNKQISRQLFIADKTVRNHITQIFAKIEVPNRAAAIVKARNAGIGIYSTERSTERRDARR